VILCNFMKITEYYCKTFISWNYSQRKKDQIQFTLNFVEIIRIFSQILQLKIVGLVTNKIKLVSDNLIVFDQGVPISLGLYFLFPAVFFELKNCPIPIHVAHLSWTKKLSFLRAPICSFFLDRELSLEALLGLKYLRLLL